MTIEKRLPPGQRWIAGYSLCSLALLMRSLHVLRTAGSVIRDDAEQKEESIVGIRIFPRNTNGACFPTLAKPGESLIQGYTLVYFVLYAYIFIKFQ